MPDTYQALLTLLRSLGDNLETLSGLADQKIKAVQTDDLTLLGEVMKQEQALSLSFRGMEQTRNRLLKEGNLEDIPLSQSAKHFPPALQEEAREAVLQLQNRYRAYQERSAAARSALEGGIQDVESAIIAMGGGSILAQEAAESSPPPSMKTDFRA